MKRSSRLTQGEEINRVRQQGQSFVHDTIVLGCLPNQSDQNRLAVIAGRSVGGAVQRNLAKRRIRSAFQYHQGGVKQGFDLVIIARKPILEVDYESLLHNLETLLERAGLMKDKAS